MKALTLPTSARLATSRKATLRPRALTARPMRASRLICRAADAGQVLSDVRSIIAEQLGTDLDKVQAESKFVDLGADSLDTVEIMMAIEEKFDTKIDEEEAPKLATVKDVADLITKQMG